MKSDLVLFGNLGGGINQGDAPVSLGRNECSAILNFDIIETHLSRRGGIERLMSLPYGAVPSQCTASTVHGVAFFDSSALLLGLYDRFARRTGISSTDIPSGVAVVAPGDDPWSIVDNKGVLWAARKNGRLWIVTEFLASIAGIDPPTVAPTLANGGAGLISVGVYQYFVTFVTSLGDESDLSPIASITIGALSDVNLTAIEVSTNPRVTSKNIYRSLPNDAGQGWLVDSIAAAATTYTDNTPNGSLGYPFEYDNGLPPAIVYSIEKFRERLWCHDNTQVYATKVGRFETFSETFDSFDARDDRQVRALHAWDSRLMVGTTQRMYQITESGFDEEGVRFDVNPFSGDHGAVSHGAMKSAEGNLFWLDNDGFYASAGGVPVNISSPRVRDILRSVEISSLESACAYIDHSRTEYACTIGTPGEEDHQQLVFNWRANTGRGAWTIRKFTDDSASGAPVSAAPTSVAQRNDVTYVAFGGYNVYEMDSGNVDRGVERNLITARARFAGVGAEGGRVIPRKVGIDVTTVDESITTRIYQDGRVQVAAENTVALDALPDRNLKRLGLGTRGATYRPACDFFEFEVEYTADDPIDINQVQFEVDRYDIKGRAQ